MSFGLVIPKPQSFESSKVENLAILESVSNQWMESFPSIIDKRVEAKLNKDLPLEGYEIIIKDGKVEISYSTEAGFFYGYVTLNQFSKLPKDFEIKDYPKYQWRGVMVDVSRHFFTPAEIKVLIDEMANLKLNRLHLHLNDNEAWRVEIKAYPFLVKKGTHYDSFPELSGKFYTQLELKDLVEYGKKRSVMIVPEIDLPGHAQALLVAMPELSCAGKGEFKLYPQEQSMRYNQAPDA
ncbi:MAG: family 20 glycosylhydrolase, partial [Lentisphaeria bacterium]